MLEIIRKSNAISNDLIGTSQSLEDVMERHGVIKGTDEYDRIESIIEEEIFLCDSCGFWYDLGDEYSNDLEQVDDTVCQSCYEDFYKE